MAVSLHFVIGIWMLASSGVYGSDTNVYNGCPGTRISLHVKESDNPNTDLVIIGNVTNVSIESRKTNYLQVRKINDTFFSIRLKTAVDTDVITHDNRAEQYTIHCQKQQGQPSTDINLLLALVDILDTNISFTNKTYNFNVKEDVRDNSVIGTVNLKYDGIKDDLTDYAPHVTVVPVNTGITMEYVTYTTWNLKVSDPRRFDFESQSDRTRNYQLHVSMSDTNGHQVSDHAAVVIHVQDVDDTNPIFSSHLYNLSVPENTTERIPGNTIHAVDGDKGLDQTINYRIISVYPHVSSFSIDKTLGYLDVTSRLDREITDTYSLTIEAYQVKEDGTTRNPFRTAVAMVTVNVLDKNDNPPVFQNRSYSINIPENLPDHSRVLRVVATDADQGKNGAFKYSIPGSSQHAFSIDGDSGEISVKQSLLLDREKHPKFTLTVWATETTSTMPRHSASTLVVITLTDENDNNPVFSEDNYQLTVDKNISLNALIGKIKATDKDAGKNGEVTYGLLGDNVERFEINNATGKLSVISSLMDDYKHWFNFTVVAEDKAQIKWRRRSTASVNVRVMDLNLNKPVIKPTNVVVELEENEQINSVVAVFTATDLDVDDNLTLSISPHDTFSIDPKSGTVRLKSQLDRETTSSYNVTVSVFDGLHTTRAILSVQVKDINDNPPTFKKNFYNVQLIEEENPKVIVKVEATDKDTGNNSCVDYSIIGEWSSNFTVDRNGSIRNVRPIDRESLLTDTLELVVLAADRGSPSLTGTTVVSVTVKDVNDNAPVFASQFITIHVKEGNNRNFYKTQAYDPDEGINGKVLYEMDGADHVITINSNGEFSASSPLSYGNISIVVRAKNSPHYAPSTLKSQTQKVLIIIEDINDNEPKFTAHIYNFSVKENLSGFKLTGTRTIKATDADHSALFNSVQYAISDGNQDGHFYIDPKHGDIYLLKPIDYEQNSSFRLQVSATDNQPSEDINHVIGNVKYAIAVVNINVEDVNDGRPTFKHDKYHCVMKENQTAISCSVTATDSDRSPVNNKITYSFNTTNTFFDIDSNNGHITCKSAPDYENIDQRRFTLVVHATDNGHSPLTGTTTVVIEVTNENDNPPVIHGHYQFSVDENTTSTVLGNILASDRDDDHLSYELMNGQHNFEVDISSGIFRTKRALDYEIPAERKFAVKIKVSDGIHEATTTIQVNVVNINDEAPFFTGQTNFTIPENTKDIYIPLKVEDKDGSLNPLHVTQSCQPNVFEMPTSTNSYSHVMKLKDTIDREDHDSITCTISASDTQHNIHTTIYITVEDKNDNSPVFTQSIYNFPITEERVSRQTLTVNANDADATSPNNRITYRLASSPWKDYFTVNNISGIIRQQKAIDREGISGDSIELDVIAVDGGQPKLSDESTVKIVVTDANDNAPYFEMKDVVFVFNEGEQPQNFFTANVTDADSTENNRKSTYSIVPSKFSAFFKIDDMTGIVSATKPLIVPSDSSMVLRIRATNIQSYTPGLRDAQMSMTIQVKFINRYSPVFSRPSYECKIKENSSVGKLNCSVHAQDNDTSTLYNTVTYWINGGNEDNTFFINSITGEIILMKPLDFETKQKYTITVLASDLQPRNGSVENVTTHVTIDVENVNDVMPKFTKETYTCTIDEGVPRDLACNISATDHEAPPNGGTLVYSLNGPESSMFSINHGTGKISCNTKLDYEKPEQRQFQFSVLAADKGSPSKTGTATVNVHVVNKNDNSPVIQGHYQFSVKENLNSATLGYIVATDPDGDNLTYTLGNNTADFTIDPNSGKFQTRRRFDFESKQEYFVAVSVTDKVYNASSTVVVRVMNVNDVTPIIEGPTHFTIPENTKDIFIPLQFRDGDGSLNELTFTMTCSYNAFDISKERGIIKVVHAIDREKHPNINCSVKVSDSLNTSPLKEIRFTIEDENDNAPHFKKSMYAMVITEGEVNKKINVKAIDDDATSPNNKVYYRIEDSAWSKHFEINPDNGTIVQKRTFDREMLSTGSFILTVTAEDKGTPSLKNTTEVTVTVNDANDESPKFEQQNVTFRFKEKQRPLRFFTPEMTDRDASAVNRKYTITISNSIYASYFSIVGGQLSAAKQLDITDQGYMEITLKASNTKQYTGNASDSYLKITIYIEDVNDHSPIFTNKTYTFLIPESSATGSRFKGIKATDGDVSAKFNTITYWISEGNDNDTFYVDRDTGELLLVKPLDYETQKQFNLQISASDLHSNYHTNHITNSTTKVQVNVEDVNDEYPLFTEDSYQCDVNENYAGVIHCGISASDNEQIPNGGSLSYSLSSGDHTMFKIHNISGIITLQTKLDYEKQRHVYRLAVAASDFGLPNRLTGTASVTVNLININDNSPIIQQSGPFSVDEQRGSNIFIGFITASDLDEGDVLSYSLLNGTSDFHINNETGELMTFRNFDYEKGDVTFYVKLQVSDSVHHPSSIITINVNNINDNDPVLDEVMNAINIPENTETGKFVTTVNASDPDNESNLEYSMTGGHGKFKIDSASGAITVINTLDFENRSRYDLLVEVKDSWKTNHPRKDQTLITVDITNVNDEPPHFIPGHYDGVIKENAPNGTSISQVFALDPDSPQQSLNYYVRNFTNIFSFKRNVLVNNRPLDCEVQSEYSLSVAVSDGKYEDDMAIHIRVEDVNDNAPKFINCSHNPCSFSTDIPYNIKNGVHVLTISAIDKDFTNHGLTYFLTNTGGDFQINDSTGEIKFYTDNYRKLVVNSTYQITVHVFDHGTPPKSNTATLSINVTTSNMHSPVFTKPNYSAEIYENVTMGSSVLHVTATDGDTGRDGEVNYVITGGSDGKFIINKITGEITVNGTFDYEKGKKTYNISIMAKDSAEDSKMSFASLIINVRNVNEKPKIMEILSTVCTSGNVAAGTNLALVTVKDEPGLLTFSLVGDNHDFEIVPNIKEIKTQATVLIKKRIDGIGGTKLQIRVCDADKLCQDANVTLETGNSGSPIFEPADVDVDILENEAYMNPRYVVDVNTTTENAGDVMYSLSTESTSQGIVINQTTGVISSHVGFHWTSSGQSFPIPVTATNGKGKCTSIVTVNITDVNDHDPVFTHCCDTLTLPEEQPESKSRCLKNFTATDEDEYNALTFSLSVDNSNHTFAINQTSKTTGCLFLVKAVDFERMPKNLNHEFKLQVTVDDGERNSSKDFVIRIQDVNDNKPKFSNNTYSIKIPEDTGINKEVGHFTATDADALDRDKITYTLSSMEDFSLRVDHDIAFLMLNSSLDRETKSSYDLILTATDTGHHTATASIHVTVMDVNDNSPVFSKPSYTFTQAEGPSSIDFKVNINVTDVDAGQNGEVYFKIASGNSGGHFNITSVNKTGTIYIQRALDREDHDMKILHNGTGLYSLLIEATDMGSPPLTGSATVLVYVLDINDCVPSFDQKMYYETVMEGTSPSTAVFSVTATDCDFNTVLNYSVSGPGKADFRINNKGEIFPLSPLIYGPKYEVTVIASDGMNENETKVIFNVTDVNDHDPEFTERVYNFSTPENDDSRVIVHRIIGSVLAHDNDTGRNSEISYKIISTDVLQLFSMDKSNGNIQTKGVLDRDSCINNRFTFTVTAEDNGQPQRTGFTEVVVTVTDINDNKPVLDSSSYTGTVTENAKGGTEVQISPPLGATDVDEGQNGTSGIVFELKGDGSSMFSIKTEGNQNDKLGILSVSCLSTCLDREIQSIFNMKIIAKDSNGTGTDLQKTISNLTIHVLDENDETPYFEQMTYIFNISEDIKDSSIVGHLKAHDDDLNGNESIRFRIDAGSDGKFYIDTLLGVLYVSGDLDRETKAQYVFNVTASDGRNENHTTVIVNVEDCNDNAPQFPQSIISLSVEENAQVNLTIGKLSATDKDVGENATISFFTNDTRLKDTFEVTPTGSIVVLRTIDREKNDSFTFFVYAKDQGQPSQMTRAIVIVTVNDTNDNMPIFYNEFNEVITSSNISILEKSPVGSPVAWPHVVDKDVGVNKEVNFTLSGDGSKYFNIDPVNGMVTMKDKIDRNILMHNGVTNAFNETVIHLFVNATDGGTPPQSNTLDLYVTIVGINDDAPTFDRPLYTFEAYENITIGTSVGNVTALSNSSVHTFTYKIPQQSLAAVNFSIDHLGSITTKTQLDREQSDSLSFVVLVTDGKTPEGTAFTMVTITVKDNNDNPPVFVTTSQHYTFLENQHNLSHPVYFRATDADKGDNAVIEYSLINVTANLFYIDNASSELYLNGTLDREALPFLSFIVQAKDKGTPSLSSQIRILVTVGDENDNSPVFDQSVYNCSVAVNSPPGTVVTSVNATDLDLSLNGTVWYSLGQDSENFMIDSHDGVLKTTGEFDHENRTEYWLTVYAHDMGDNPMTSTASVIVTIDLKNERPRFNKTLYEVTLNSFVPVNTPVTTVSVVTRNQAVYTFDDSNAGMLYSLNNITGEIFTNAPLDGYSADQILTIKAANEYNSELYDTTKVLIRIQHGNSAAFTKHKYPVVIEENTNYTLPILDLNTTQEINNESVRYDIVSVQPNDGGAFVIDHSTGVITTQSLFNREHTSQYIVHVSAEVVTQSSRVKRSFGDNLGEAVVVVNIADQDDNPPTFGLQGKQHLTYYVPGSLQAGDFVVNITATDPDISSTIQYTMKSNDGKDMVFYIGQRTGEVRALKGLGRLDSSNFSMTVSANDEVNPPSQVLAKFILIPDDSRLIFVAPTTPDRFLDNQDVLMRNMSAIIGLNVHVIKIRPHLTSKAVNPLKTDVFLFATENKTGKVQDKEHVTNLIMENLTPIRKLFACLSNDSDSCVVVSEPVSHTPYSWSAAEIALLVIAIIMLLTTVIAILILRHFHEEFDMAKQHEVEMFELESHHADSVGDQYQVVNPAFDESEFTETKDKMTKDFDTESQERVMDFGPEELHVNEIHEDSGVENDSSSSSNNDPAEAEMSRHIEVLPENNLQGSEETSQDGSNSITDDVDTGRKRSASIVVIDMDTGATDDYDDDTDEIDNTQLSDTDKSSQSVTTDEVEVDYNRVTFSESVLVTEYVEADEDCDTQL